MRTTTSDLPVGLPDCFSLATRRAKRWVSKDRPKREILRLTIDQGSKDVDHLGYRVPRTGECTDERDGGLDRGGGKSFGQ